MVEESLGSSSTIPTIQNFTETFEKYCPVYMAMGMSYDEYWNGPAEMVRLYRKSFELKKKQMNERLWLQGMYIYKALEKVYPLFNSWAEKQPEPYLEFPIPLTPEEEKENQREHDKREMEKLRDYMDRQMMKGKEENP